MKGLLIAILIVLIVIAGVQVKNYIDRKEQEARMSPSVSAAQAKCERDHANLMGHSRADLLASIEKCVRMQSWRFPWSPHP